MLRKSSHHAIDQVDLLKGVVHNLRIDFIRMILRYIQASNYQNSLERKKKR